jgi:hypothetical protein
MAAESKPSAVSDRSRPRPSPEGLWLARFLAELLDQRFVIPGTSIRIGLDPIIGLIPGVGDALANLAGSAILVIAARIGIPKIILLRMALNIAANAAIGSIPFVGDLFSIWFRSNANNARLLERYAAAGEQPSTLKDWALIAALLSCALAVIIGTLLAVAYLARQLAASL